jgi:hypothetical protein
MLLTAASVVTSLLSTFGGVKLSETNVDMVCEPQTSTLAAADPPLFLVLSVLHL